VAKTSSAISKPSLVNHDDEEESFSLGAAAPKVDEGVRGFYSLVFSACKELTWFTKI